MVSSTHWGTPVETLEYYNPYYADHVVQEPPYPQLFGNACTYIYMRICKENSLSQGEFMREGNCNCSSESTSDSEVKS